MATYTYKKCPHCGKTYESYSTYTKDFNNHQGSPFVRCRFCGNIFVDKEIKEPALEPYTGKGFELWRCYFTFLMPFGLGGVAALLCAFNAEKYGPLLGLVGLILLALYAFLTFSTVVDREKLKEDDRKQYEESERRLMNPEYAKALKEAGFNVPSKYLKEPEVFAEKVQNINN